MQYIINDKRVSYWCIMLLFLMMPSAYGITPKSQNDMVNPQTGQNIWQLDKNIGVTLDDLQATTTMCCPCDYFITQADIPAIITQPGIYCVTENISFDSGDAITITTSSVTIDLNGHVLDGGTVGEDGVVATSQADITIQNGAIQNVQNAGISMTNITHSVVRNITVINVTNVDSTKGGIYYDQDSSDVLIEDCSVSEVAADVGIASGAYVILANNVLIRNSQAIANTNFGFVFTGNNITMENCTAYDNGQGITFESVSNFVVRDCTCIDNGAGFYFDNASCGTIINCSAISSSDGDGFGISSSSNIVVKNCSSNCNVGDGFELLDFNDCILMSSSAMGNHLYGIQNSGSNNQIFNNIAINNTSGDYNGVTQPIVASGSVTTTTGFWTDISS
jgi:parallel beta-helix repeat protein